VLLALLALATCAVVLSLPLLVRATVRWRKRRAARRTPAGALEAALYDPGRERRAEQRARELLRSCVNDEEWAMYRDLGFIRVAGGFARRASDGASKPPYAYLIYPQKPVVAYVPETGQLLSEYCVECTWWDVSTTPAGSAVTCGGSGSGSGAGPVGLPPRAASSAGSRPTPGEPRPQR